MDLLPVTCGVPQGSILGPFSRLFVNDLLEALSCNIKTDLYVDDTAPTVISSQPQDSETQLNDALAEAVNWFNSSKLSINLKEIYFSVFGPGARRHACNEIAVKHGESSVRIS